MIQNKSVVAKLFDEIGPKYEDRNGGYTRITRTTYRQGMRAIMLMQLLPMVLEKCQMKIGFLLILLSMHLVKQ